MGGKQKRKERKRENCDRREWVMAVPFGLLCMMVHRNGDAIDHAAAGKHCLDLFRRGVPIHVAHIDGSFVDFRAAFSAIGWERGAQLSRGKKSHEEKRVCDAARKTKHRSTHKTLYVVPSCPAKPFT